MNRRFYALITFPLAAVLAMTSCSQNNSGDASSKADVYFENGVIYTADEDDTIVDAIAIKDDKIVFVGSSLLGGGYKENAKEVVDLQGKMLLPSFIDSHIHVVSEEFVDFSLVGVTNISSAVNIVKETVYNTPGKNAYFGMGFDTNSLFSSGGDELKKGPRKERLDEVVPDKPVIIYSYDGHSAWLNSKGLEYCNITKTTQPPSGGTIVIDESNGELWGTLNDTAMSLIPDPEISGMKLLNAIDDFQEDLNEFGYTSIMTLPANGYMDVPYEGISKLEQMGELNLRVRAAGIVRSSSVDQDIAKLQELRKKYNSDMFKVNTAKIFLDGVLDNETALLEQPYDDNLSSHGRTDWKTQDDVNQAYAKLNKEGIQVHSHAIGDAAVNVGLNACEYAKNNAPEGDYRNVLTHVQLTAPENLPRFNELGVVAVLQPFWHYKAPSLWENKELAALGERAETEYPLKSLADNGTTLAFSSDYPVTPIPNPFEAIQTGVTRNLSIDYLDVKVKDLTGMDDPRFLLDAKERLSVKDMIKGYTMGSAYSMFIDDVTGSLEEGKSADLIMINQDLFKVDPLKIKDTEVLRTYFKGKLVHRYNN